MSSTADNTNRSMTVPDIRARKGGVPIVAVVAYTTPIAKILDPVVDLILVGDSVGMVMHGRRSTVGVTLEMMIMHGQSVVAGAKRPCVVVDMPFGSYESSPQKAFANAARIMSETDCDAVKLEGGTTMRDTIKFLTERGIPVVGHIGLQPQQVNATGGFKARGGMDGAAKAILADAHAVAGSGAFAVVVEGVVEALGRQITKEIDIPTIGIGASPACDGQILLIDDLTGLFTDFKPRFVKRYANVAAIITEAIESYADDVRSRKFPAAEHLFGAKPTPK